MLVTCYSNMRKSWWVFNPVLVTCTNNTRKPWWVFNPVLVTCYFNTRKSWWVFNPVLVTCYNNMRTSWWVFNPVHVTCYNNTRKSWWVFNPVLVTLIWESLDESLTSTRIGHRNIFSCLYIPLRHYYFVAMKNKWVGHFMILSNVLLNVLFLQPARH